MDEELQLRLVEAVEALAGAILLIAKIQQQRFDKQYPVRQEIKDVTLTHRQTEEEKLRESQGASDEPDSVWTTIGPREAQFEKAQERAARREAKRGAAPPRSKRAGAKKRP